MQAQDHADWEMLVVDDASTNRTRDRVRDLAAADSRIRLVRQREHGGPALARNAGLERARGRYVAFLDSDDLWLPHKLSEQLAIMKKRKAVLLYSAYGFIDENGAGIGQPIRVPALLDYYAFLRNPIIGCLTVMVDREKTGPLQMPLLPQHEDFALWSSILKRGVVAQGIPEELARYRIVGGSVSRNKIRAAVHMWRVYREVERLKLPYALWCYGQYAWRAYWKLPRRRDGAMRRGEGEPAQAPRAMNSGLRKPGLR